MADGTTMLCWVCNAKCGACPSVRRPPISAASILPPEFLDLPVLDISCLSDNIRSCAFTTRMNAYKVRSAYRVRMPFLEVCLYGESTYMVNMPERWSVPICSEILIALTTRIWWKCLYSGCAYSLMWHGYGYSWLYFKVGMRVVIYRNVSKWHVSLGRICH